jgi:hypothetical protein
MSAPLPTPRFIAHRGNCRGTATKDLENSPVHIGAALAEGFDVEVDVWLCGDDQERWMLGHDDPQHETTLEFLLQPGVWCHAKHGQALSALLAAGAERVFAHERDPVVAVGRTGIAWAYPGQPIDKHTVCVMPEQCAVYREPQLHTCFGICSDYVAFYRQRACAKVRIALLIGGRFTCQQRCLLPQVELYLKEHPDHWIDVHACIGGDSIQGSSSSHPPYMATLQCAPYTVPADLAQCGQVRKRPETNATNALSMLYHNHQAWLAAQAYARHHGVQYTAWLKFRPDIVSSDGRLPEMVVVDDDTVAMPSDHHFGDYGRANDQVAWGHALEGNAAKAYFGTYGGILDNFHNVPGYHIHPESMLRYALNQAGVHVSMFNYNYSLDPFR